MPQSTTFVTTFLLGLAVAPLNGCGGDARVIDESSESNEEQSGNPMREGPAGCYIGAERRCDCELEEADCSNETGGTWVPEGCASCAE